MISSFILVSSYSIPKTGAHIRFDRLVTYLAEEGHSIIWISPKRNDIELGANVEFLDMGDMTGKNLVSLWMLVGVLRNAFRLVQLRSSELLLISFGETNLIPSAMVSFLSKAPMSFGMRSNIKKCIEANKAGSKNIEPKYKLVLMFVAMAIWGWIYRQAVQVTVQTPQAKASAISNFGILETKISIVENDLPLVRTSGYSKGISSIPCRALFVGDDSYVKGFDVIVNAIAGFNEYAPTITELIVIGVSSDAFDELVFNSGSGGPKLTRLDRTNELISVMSKSDLLIVPSRQDQFPNVVLEALALCIPVVGSNCDGIAYILDNDCLLFETGNARDLLRTLSFVCTVDGYASAREIVKNRADQFRFFWEKRYFDLLPRICSKN